jgi:hypothetical protein
VVHGVGLFWFLVAELLTLPLGLSPTNCIKQLAAGGPEVSCWPLAGKEKARCNGKSCRRTFHVQAEAKGKSFGTTAYARRLLRYLTVPSRQNPVPSQPQVIDLFGSPGRIRTSDQPVNSRSASLPTLDLKLDAISAARGNESRGSSGRRAGSRCHVTRRSGSAALRVPAASHVKISSRLPAVSFSWSGEPVTLPTGSPAAASYNPNDCALGISGATWYRPG